MDEALTSSPGVTATVCVPALLEMIRSFTPASQQLFWPLFCLEQQKKISLSSEPLQKQAT